MGLFDKKACTGCGKKIGFFSGLFAGHTLGDGSNLCGDCVKKCSPELKDADFKRMTEADFLKHVLAREEDKKRFATEFQKTRTIGSGEGGLGTPYIYVDETHGWWANAKVTDPDVFTFSQAGSVTVDASSMTLSSDEEKRRKEMEWVQLYNSIAGGYPGVPTCPPNKRISSLTIRIGIVDHPYVSEVDLTMMINSTTVQYLLKEQFRTVSEIVQFFMYLRNRG